PCYVPTRPSAPFTPLFPYTTLFRSLGRGDKNIAWAGNHVDWLQLGIIIAVGQQRNALRATDSPYFIHAQDGAGSQNRRVRKPTEDRKSTRLNSSHVSSSYAVFCLKK